MKRSTVNKPKTDADILKEIEELVKTSREERNRREGNYVHRRRTPYGKYEEIIVGGKKKQNNYFINEKKILSSSLGGKLYSSKDGKDAIHSVDELLRTYAVDMRNQEKHHYSEQEVKVKFASVPHIATEKKVDAYLTVNPKPNIKYANASNRKDIDFSEDNKFIEVGKADSFALEQLDSEILEAGGSTSAVYPNKSQALSVPSSSQSKDRLKHISAVRLRKKYPRFCSNLTFTDADLKNITARHDKWISKFMEICYDEAAHSFNSEGLHGKLHYYEGMNLGNLDNFPFLVQRILTQYFSVLEVRKRVTLEVLYTLELLLERSEIGRFKSVFKSDILRYDPGRGHLFSKFLSEEYDVDILAVFLNVRSFIQNSLGKKLKDVNPARIVIPKGDPVSSERLLESRFVQQRIEQQQIFSPNSKLNPRDISWFSTSSGENNAFLTNLQDTDNYLHATFSRSFNQSTLPPPPTASTLSKTAPLQNLLIQKVVPVELPAKWYYLTDITLLEAPVIGFHESLLWYFICLIIPSPPSHYLSSSQQPHLGLPNEDSVQEVRQYLKQKVWDMASFDIMKDTTNQRVTKTSGLQQIPTYTLLRAICHEWKKLSKEEKSEFSYEGLLNDSLKSLNTIYDNNCAKLKIMEQSVLDCESNLVLAKSKVSKLEKDLKRFERKLERKIAIGNEVLKIATLRDELNQAKIVRQDCDHKLSDTLHQKKKLLKTTEDLWGIVMARANKKGNTNQHFESLSPAKDVKKQLQEEAAAEKDLKASFWKNYVTFMLNKILEKNLRKETIMKQTQQESKQIIAKLESTNKLIKPSAVTTLYDQPIHAKEIMKSAVAIEKLLVETMARIFVRTVINDGKRKVLLSHHLNIRQHELLLLYGGEEYLRQEQERRLKKRLAEAAALREKERRSWIHHLTPVLVSEIIDEGRKRAFDSLYDPYWMLGLPIIEIVGYKTAQIVENKFKDYLQSLVILAYRKMALPVQYKRVRRARHRRLVKRVWKKWISACSMNSKLLMKVKKIQRCIRCFLWTCRYLKFLKDQRRMMILASIQYESHLRLKRKPFFEFWWKYLHLHRRYTATKFALAERRFLICFYTWKDKFIKLRYQKMKLSKLQTNCCILIQSIIRQFIAKRRVSKLLAKRKITSWIQIVVAKRFRQHLKEYRFRVDDFYHRVVYNNRFGLLREAYRLWKRSYNILLGLAKLSHAKNHYRIRCRYLKWRRFTKLKTKYLTAYAIKIQSVIRMFLVTRRYWQYHRWRRSFVKLQSLYRMHRAVYYFSYDIYYYRRAKLIQKIFRGYKVRKNIYLARIADIHVCAYHNKYERLKYYCEKYPELIYRKDEEGNTPLHTAAKAAAKRTMKLLIKHMRLNPNEVNNQGYTALHLLIMSSAVHRDEIFHYVLERGFDDDQLTTSGKSCVLLAAEYNRMIILKKLLDDGHDANLADQSGLTPIQCACSQGNLAMLQLLIENEGNVHQSGMNGTYPVHDCITGNNIEVLYALLREQVDVNVTDPMYSQTPLMWAAQAGLGEFCRTLIIHNSDIHHKDYQGRTVAHYAAMCNVPDVYHALREGDVEFDVVDGEGNSPLHLCAYYGTVEMTKNILHGGVYPSYQNDIDGEQPSHIAAKYNQLEILQLICEYDEYIGRPNFHHQTPLGLAKFYNCVDCINFLERHYRMVEIIDGRNALGEIWWDKQIDEEVLSAWDVIVQSDGSRIYVNKVNGQRSLKPPSVKSVDLVKNLAQKKNALPLRRVIELVKEEAESEEEVGADGKLHKSKNTLTKHEYYLEYRQNKEDIKLMSIDYRAATTIVKFARRKLAYMEAKRLRLVTAKRKVLRRFYRIYIRSFLAFRRVHRTKQANKMQQVVRGYLARKRFFSPPNGLYFLYRERRAKRILRYKLWDMYRLYRFKKELQLKIAIKHHFNYTLQDWQIILDKVRKPVRIINIYEEYKFPNMVNLKFYRNIMTGNCFFIKPKEIIAYDENMAKEEKERNQNQGVTKKQLQLIVKLQSLIRGYIIRTAYRHLEKALHICQYAKQNYLESPEKDIHLYNYALYCLVMEQDIDRARSVFLECLRRMQWRGPDNAFVLYSYAIFGLKSGDEEMGEVRSFIERANKAEKWKYEAFVKKLESQYSNAMTGGIIPTSPSMTPREAGSNPVVNPSSNTGKSNIQPFRYGRIYDLAKAGFFRYAATVFNNSYGWECHALCMFLVYRDFNASFDSFMQAFKTDPTNKQLRKNFDLMMIFFHGKDREKREAVLNERMRYLAALDNEIEENRRRSRERHLKRETSARKIQRWYKDRRAIRNFNSFLKAVQMHITGGKSSSASKKRRQNLM